MSDMNTAPSSFVALMQAFQAFVHVKVENPSDPVGLEFKAQGHTARVMPHPTRPSGLLVEIDVCAAGESNAAALLLHRLNYLARFAHTWSMAIDDDDVVVIYTTRTIASTDSGALEALIVDGLNRATAIQRLWEQQLIGMKTPTTIGINMLLGGLKA